MEADQNDKDMPILEGKAKIFQKSGVFYNKVQEFNRDLRLVLYFSADSALPKPYSACYVVFTLIIFSILSSVLAVHTFLKNTYWRKSKKDFVRNNVS